jgi:hypothetical protein
MPNTEPIQFLCRRPVRAIHTAPVVKRIAQFKQLRPGFLVKIFPQVFSHLAVGQLIVNFPLFTTLDVIQLKAFFVEK